MPRTDYGAEYLGQNIYTNERRYVVLLRDDFTEQGSGPAVFGLLTEQEAEQYRQSLIEQGVEDQYISVQIVGPAIL